MGDENPEGPDRWKDPRFAEVERRKVVEGPWAMFECAVCTDLTSPASQALDELAKGVFPDPEQDRYPDKRQVQDRFLLLDLMHRIAGGDDFLGTSMNYLRDGIWELKVGAIRMSFYDTDGFGYPATTCFTEGTGIDWKAKLLPEDFGFLVRLGYTFGKPLNVRKTRVEDLKLAELVRKEDLEHDRERS